MTKPPGLAFTVFTTLAVAKRGPVRLDRPKEKVLSKRRQGAETFDGALVIAQRPPKAVVLEPSTTAKVAPLSAPTSRVADARRLAVVADEGAPRAKGAEALPTAAPPAPAAVTSPSSTVEALKALEAPRSAYPTEALLQATLHDASLQLELGAHRLRVGLETEAAGALQLDVRLHEGRAEVHLDGPASPLVASHAAELREVLAREGLSFGNFSQGSRGERERSDEAPSRPRPETPSPPVKEPAATRRHDGRIDVEA